MDMKKLNSPKLEVLQFNMEDVIVTSSASTIQSLISGQRYFALGSEMHDARPDAEIRNSDTVYYKFQYNAISNQYSYFPDYSLLKHIANDPNPGYYAWWDDFSWRTDNQNYTFYSSIGYTH